MNIFYSYLVSLEGLFTEYIFLVVLEEEVVIRVALDMYCFDALVHQRFEGIDILFVLSGYKDAVVLQFRHPSSLQFVEGDILSFDRCQVVFVFRRVGKGVYLIEDNYTRNIGDL